jgi:hypothetical protein
VKSVLVGKLLDTKVYYVVDSIHKDSDCILVGRFGDTKVTNFWRFVDWNHNIHKITNTQFHKKLWHGHESKTSTYWYSVFVEKALPVERELLEDVVINEDVLRRRKKVLEFENRAIDFLVSLKSQVPSTRMMVNFVGRNKSTKRLKRGAKNDE